MKAKNEQGINFLDKAVLILTPFVLLCIVCADIAFIIGTYDESAAGAHDIRFMLGITQLFLIIGFPIVAVILEVLFPKSTRRNSVRWVLLAVYLAVCALHVWIMNTL